jgi:hypothetical protein
MQTELALTPTGLEIGRQCSSVPHFGTSFQNCPSFIPYLQPGLSIIAAADCQLILAGIFWIGGMGPFTTVDIAKRRQTVSMQTQTRSQTCGVHIIGCLLLPFDSRDELQTKALCC